jgi:hypothetical protein
MSSKINLQTCEYACKSSIFQDNQLIYGKKGNNERENTGKAADSSGKVFAILQKKRMRVWLEGAESEQTWRWKQRNAFRRKT